MSISTDLNKILPECQMLLLHANDIMEEIHKKVLVDREYQALCHYRPIPCFYDGLKNNNYHLLVRVCKCGEKTDRSYWLEQISKRGYIDISEIVETDGIELHINKVDPDYDCIYKERKDPHDVKVEGEDPHDIKKGKKYLLKKQYCQCPRHWPTATR